MLTRREVLTAGALFGSLVPLTTLALFDDAKSEATSFADTMALPPISALLTDYEVDESSRCAQDLRTQLQGITILPATLDAKFYGELNMLFRSHRSIGGITTGAALFCLERIAWDHGLRLAWRRSFTLAATGHDALPFPMLARSFTGDSRALTPSNPIRGYRNSRSDRLIHAWILNPKPASTEQA